MTEKQALLAAIFIISDSIDEFNHSDYYEPVDPWLLEMKEAQAKLKEMFERKV